jgi:hypothetical protein
MQNSVNNSALPQSLAGFRVIYDSNLGNDPILQFGLINIVLLVLIHRSKIDMHACMHGSY